MYIWYANMQKRRDGKVYSDLHKTDKKIHFLAEDAQAAIDRDLVTAPFRHVVPMVTETEQVWNEIVRKIDAYEQALEVIAQSGDSRVAATAKQVLEEYGDLRGNQASVAGVPDDAGVPGPQLYTHEDFLQNPGKYALFRTARIAEAIFHIPELALDRIVKIQYFATGVNRMRGNVEMPIYQVWTDDNEDLRKMPALAYACVLKDFML